MKCSNCHKEVCDLIKRWKSLNDNLIANKQHSKGISEYLSYGRKDTKIYHWYHIGGSIVDINYNGITKDNSFYWCRPSYEDEKEKQKVYTKLVNEISFFLYVFNGLECLITNTPELNIGNTSKKFELADKIIAAKMNQSLYLDKYLNDLLILFKEIGVILFDDFKFLLRKQKNRCTTFIYHIRNKLSHGDFVFPETGDYPPYSKLYPLIVNLCSRLTLISTQYLLLSSITKSAYFQLYYSSIISCYNDFEDGYFINDIDYLNNIHMKEVEWEKLYTN